MSKILKVSNVGDYIRYVGEQEQHPLVGIIDYAALSPVRHSLNNYGVYGVFMHEHLSVDLTYGCGKYDYRNGERSFAWPPARLEARRIMGNA